MDDNYYAERDKRNTEKIRQLTSELPRFVNEFFIGIQLKTTPLTRLNYAYDLRIFFDYLSNSILKKAIKEITINDIKTITSFDIELFLEYLTNYKYGDKNYKCNAQGKERKLSTLRSFFKYYFKKDKLEANVAAKVDMPKLRDKPIIRLEPNEIANLLDKIESENIHEHSPRQNKYHRLTRLRDLAIITLFLGTGIRISELVGLNLDDIDFQNNSFRVTRKGGSQSILYFSQEIAIALQNYQSDIQDQIDNKTDFASKITDTSALFLSLQGTRLTVRAVEKLVKKYSQLVTPLKKITPHKLRSTFGTELYRNTQDIYIVADVLGHKDVNTTKKHYAAISEDLRRNAAQTIKLRDNDDNNQ